LGQTARESQARQPDQIRFDLKQLEDKMLKGFRDFILRGNVVDLAVAVIIGASFGAITASVTADVITPTISALVGAPDFSSLVVHVPVLNPVPPPAHPPANYIPPGEIHIGKFLNALISFVLNAGAIYFGIVLPMQYLLKRFSPPAPPPPPSTRPCPECLSDIPLAAKRCAHCAQPVAQTPVTP
jgi:large conductance mechanosensitive channel